MSEGNSYTIKGMTNDIYFEKLQTKAIVSGFIYSKTLQIALSGGFYTILSVNPGIKDTSVLNKRQIADNKGFFSCILDLFVGSNY